MGRPLRVTHANRVAHCTIHAADGIWFNDRDLKIFQATLRTLVERHKYVIEYYSLLENHGHFQMRFTEDKSCGDIMGNIFSCMTKAYNKVTGRKGHLWRERYKDFHIDTDHYYWASTAYVTLNRLKTGSINSIEEDVSSSWAAYAHGIDDGITTLSEHYLELGDTPQERQREFRHIVSESWKAWQDRQTWEEIQNGKEVIASNHVNMAELFEMFDQEEEQCIEIRSKRGKRAASQQTHHDPDNEGPETRDEGPIGAADDDYETIQARERAQATHRVRKQEQSKTLVAMGIPVRALDAFWGEEDFIADFVTDHYDRFGMTRPPQ